MLKVAVWGEAPRMLKVTKLNFVLPSDYGLNPLNVSACHPGTS